MSWPLLYVMFLQAAVSAPAPVPGPPADPPAPVAITLTADNFIKPSQQRMNEILLDHVSPGLPGGAAIVECAVASAGKLVACRVVSETPAGVGVGKAALEMVRLFKLPPVLPTGEKVEGGIVRVPMHFGR